MERALVVCLRAEERHDVERGLRSCGLEVIAQRVVSRKRIVPQSAEDSKAMAYVVAGLDALAVAQRGTAGLEVYTSPDFGFMFPQLDRNAEADAGSAKEYLKRASTGSSANSKAQLVQSLLVSGLTELCREKPAGLEAVRFLGEWLLRNNPDQEAAGRAASWMDGARANSASVRKPSIARLPPRPPLASDPAKVAPEEVQDAEIVFVLGGPGSGKGTQCEMLAARFGFEHVSTGELLRQEVEAGTPTGAAILATMKAGGLVDVGTTVALLDKALSRSTATRFLVDGFPREMDQVAAFEEAVGPCSYVLNMACSEEVSRARMRLRKRKDDTEDTITQRLATFHERTVPVIEHFAAAAKVRTVAQDSAAETPEHVFQRVLGCVAMRIVLDVSGCAKLGDDDVLLDVPAMVKKESQRGSPLGQRINVILARGQLVSDDLVLDLLKRSVFRRATSTCFVLRGYPRTLAQCAAFEAAVSPISYAVEAPSPAAAPAPEYAALVSYLGAHGRLRETSSASAPRSYVLDFSALGASSAAASATTVVSVPEGTEEEDVVDVVAEAARNTVGDSRDITVTGFPRDAGLMSDLAERLGRPKAVVLDDADVDEDGAFSGLAVEGKVRRASAFRGGVEVVAVVGSGGLAAAERAALLRTVAGEFQYALLDFDAAWASLADCAGTWEAQTKVRAAAAEQEVQTEASVARQRADLLVAKRNLVARAAASCGKRGLIVLFSGADDDVDAELALVAAVKPARVLCLQFSDANAAKERVRAQIRDEHKAAQSKVESDGDGDAPAELDEDDLSATAEARFAQLEAAQGARSDTPDTADVDCSPSALLERLREPFFVDVYVLACDDSVQARGLAVALANKCGMVLVNVPELLPRASDSNSDSEAAQIVASARSTPLDISIPAVRAQVARLAASGARRVLLRGLPTAVGEGFPFAHDQLFALERHVGPVKLCIQSGPCADEALIELFSSLDRFVHVERPEDAAAAVVAATAKEQEQLRIDTWAPGDGSPQALLQGVMDKYRPNRSSAKTAEEYFAQFDVDPATGAVPLDHVVAKMKTWGLENDPREHLTADAVAHHEWFEYVFQRLLLLDEYVEPPPAEVANPDADDEDAEHDA